MALPNGAAGYQLGDGNRNEPVMGYASAPVTATDTATLTAAQVLNGIILATPTAAADYTLPTVADFEAGGISSAGVGNTFDFVIINLASNSSYDITILTNTGWTVTGGGSVVVENSSSARFRARKTSSTTWQLYRIS